MHALLVTQVLDHVLFDFLGIISACASPSEVDQTHLLFCVFLEHLMSVFLLQQLVSKNMYFHVFILHYYTVLHNSSVSTHNNTILCTH